MRLKIKITIQKEVMNGAILQQVDTLGPTNTQMPYIHMHTCILYIHKHSSLLYYMLFVLSLGRSDRFHYPQPAVQELRGLLRSGRLACGGASASEGQPQEDLLLLGASHSEARCPLGLHSHRCKNTLHYILTYIHVCTFKYKHSMWYYF